MPLAAWCSECAAHVWVGADGRCQNGHPAESVSQAYEAAPPPAQPSVAHASEGPAYLAAPRSHVWLWALLGGTLLLLAALMGAGAWAFWSYASNVESLPNTPKRSAAVDRFVAREYPEYEMADSEFYPNDYYTDLPGTRYLLQSKSGRFPRALEVGVFKGELVDLESSMREDHVQVGEFVTDDGVFSATGRRKNHITDADLAALGTKFGAARLGENPVISYASYDVEYRDLWFDVAADAPRRLSFDTEGVGATHSAQISRSPGSASWGPLDASRIEDQ